jgi:hypothetical protein
MKTNDKAEMAVARTYKWFWRTGTSIAFKLLRNHLIKHLHIPFDLLLSVVV